MVYKLLKPQLFISQTVQLNNSQITRKLRQNIVILFENQIQTASTSPCRTQVQPAASFLVCFLIFIEYKKGVPSITIVYHIKKKPKYRIVFEFLN